MRYFLAFWLCLLSSVAFAQPSGAPQTKIWDGTETATVRNTGSDHSLNVAIVDGSGNQITSFGGGTQYTEGDTDATITGTACMMEGATNALVPLQGTASDGLLVNLGSNNDISGTVTCNAGTNLNTSALATSANQSTVIGHVDGIEGLLATIDADTGTLAGAVSGTEMQVDVLTIPSISGTVTCNAGTNLNTSSLATEATLSTLNGKITACNTGAVTISAALPAGTNAIGKLAANSGVDIGDVDVTSIAAGNNNIGDVDIASIAAGNNNIGDVDVASLPSVTIGTFPDNEPINVAQMNGVAVTMGNGASGTGVQRVTIASDSTGIVNQGGTWTVQPGNTANTTAWLVSPRPATSGGLTIFRSIDLDETEEEIKASAGQLYGYYLFNAAASVRYFKFYNATAANVTVGTTTPVITIPVPAGSAANVEFSHGVAFGTAITAACTTGIADSDTGAPGANECILDAFYN